MHLLFVSYSCLSSQRPCSIIIAHHRLTFQTADARAVESRVKKLSKMPQHLCIAVLESHMSYSDLANLVVWSIAADIKFITLWDPKGVFVNVTWWLSRCFALFKL